MFGMKSKLINETRKVVHAADRMAIRALFKQAGFLRTTMARSIRRGAKPSAAGSPPHSQSRRLPRSIRFDVDRVRQMAIIGPSYDMIGIAGAEHEHGGRFRRESFKKRPFARPALDKVRPKLAGIYENSLR